MSPDSVFRKLGFAPFHEAAGRASVADLFPERKRCGIYALRFSNGEFYIGKSGDVTRRFVQHTRAHQDIQRIAFRPLREALLDKEERHCVTQAEASRVVLRNVQIVSVVTGETDLDLIIDPKAQERWEQTGKQPAIATTRPIDSALRGRYAKKFERLRQLRYGSETIELLRRYLAIGLLAPAATELSFWALSALPTGFSAPGWICHSRINVNWQEVCTIGTLDGHGRLSLHLARSVVTRMARGQGVQALAKTIPELELSEHAYAPGGRDQFNLLVSGFEAAERLLNHPSICAAIRALNLRLMRKGPTPYGRYHCFDLADRMFV